MKTSQIIELEIMRKKRLMLEKEHPLRQLFWEVTLRCNLACRHCGSDCRKEAAVPDMPLEHFLPDGCGGGHGFLVLSLFGFAHGDDGFALCPVAGRHQVDAVAAACLGQVADAWRRPAVPPQGPVIAQLAVVAAVVGPHGGDAVKGFASLFACHAGDAPCQVEPGDECGGNVDAVLLEVGGELVQVHWVVGLAGPGIAVFH